MPVEFASPVYSDGIKQKTQTKFAGLDHTSGAADGAIFDMKNLTADEYPVARPRDARAELRTLTKPNGICLFDEMYYVDGTSLRKLVNVTGETDTVCGTVTDTPKKFACIGAYIIILPDKKYLNRLTGESGSLEAEWTGTASFADGQYAGEDAEGCRIKTTGTEFPFKAGDAVEISGATDAGNNKTIIIREISDDKKDLGFYENSFTAATNQTLTLKRGVPDLDFICENENRLWGCKGNTIYASKPGDPFNWNVFDGLASDSYAVDVGSAGNFTACVSYLGYPIFFKENRIYKVYGSKPSDFQVMSSATLGVLTGAERTLAVAGETLFYLSPVGILAYTGGIPENISMPFGTTRFTGGTGGSDGIRYFASLTADDGTTTLYCYDTRYGLWHKQDDLKAVGFARGEGATYQGAFALGDDGKIIRVSGTGSSDGWTPEGKISSMLEFADFLEGSPNKKSTAKILLRVGLETGASLTVELKSDGGAWKNVRTLPPSDKKSYYLPINIRRCDHFRIRLRGTGMWRLYSLTREASEGSPNK